jgi:hypothetical protein
VSGAACARAEPTAALSVVQAHAGRPTGSSVGSVIARSVRLPHPCADVESRERDGRAHAACERTPCDTSPAVTARATLSPSTWASPPWRAEV